MEKEKKIIDVIVGCQFGSEAKGLVASYVASIEKYDWLISVNSAQAGHTAPYWKEGEKEPEMIVTRQLPSSCITDFEAKIFIGPGAVINPEVLVEEIIMLEEKGIPICDRLFISENATIVTEEDIIAESVNNLTNRLGSTNEGIGSALAMRAMRKSLQIKNSFIDIIKNLKSKGLEKSFTLVSDYFSVDHISGKILIEGSQGYGLSIMSGYYPFCTSRDTTTAAFLSYAQLSPLDVRDVYGVYRTYPIRVGGNSGPMHEEIDWPIIEGRSGYKDLAEFTTVTKRMRRIGEWDNNLAKKATIVNGVTKPILCFANYLDKNVENALCLDEFPEEILQEIAKRAESIGQPWFAISTNKHGNFLT